MLFRGLGFVENILMFLRIWNSKKDLFSDRKRKYGAGDYGESCDDIGCKVIIDLQYCRQAIKRSGIAISSEWIKPDTTYVHGCSLNSDNVLHFNTIDGVTRFSEKPYCYCPGNLTFPIFS